MTIKKIIIILSFPLLFIGCVTYSFVDGSINAKTFSVSVFEDQAPNAPAGYGAQYTEFLKDYVISRSKLSLKNIGADIEISGKITGYNTAPASVQAGSDAAQNKLTVTIQVQVINNLDEKESFETSFSQFMLYPATSELSAVETTLLEEINGRLSQDIINKLTSNW